MNSDYVIEINTVQKSIEDIQKNISSLEKKLSNLRAYKNQLETVEFAKDRPYSKPASDYVDKILTPIINALKSQKFIFVSQDGKQYDFCKEGYYVMIEPETYERNYYCYVMGGATGAYKTYAKYKTLQRFKSVIDELANAVKRGDTEFKFPAND